MCRMKELWHNLFNKIVTNDFLKPLIFFAVRKEFLGEFEELVLLVTAILEKNAYGKMIVDEIRNQTNRVVTLSAVHITLYRLEDKGFLKSEIGGSSETRGGRRKRLFSITNAGLSTLRTLRDLRLNLWQQIQFLR